MPGGRTHHQQTIWLEKVSKVVSLTYHDNIKRIYRKIAKKMPQCFACIRGGWGFIDRVTGSPHLEKQSSAFMNQTLVNDARTCL